MTIDCETILIADEDRFMGELLERRLAREARNIVQVDSGEDVLDTARKTRPDLVLLDALIPGLDGFAVLRKLKADPVLQSVPVLMVTALSAESGRPTAERLGASDYLTKPFDPAQLKDRIEAVLALASRTTGGVS